MPDDCILWGGGYNGHGYGQTYARRFGKLTRGAHIVAWIDANGRLPAAGEIVRHTCDNPPCINPAHLVIGTKKDNTQDAVERKRLHNIRKTHCPHGHEYSLENTYVYTTRQGGIGRYCKTCVRKRNREAARRKAAL